MDAKLPDNGKKSWGKSTPCPHKPLTPKQVAKHLSAITGLPVQECRYLFDAVSATMFHELANERPFRIPGVGLVTPILKGPIKYMDLQTGGWRVSPNWIAVRFRVFKELKSRFRLRYPYYDESEVKPEEPVDALL